ncbi:MAG: hypothetical protein ABII82_13885, partial [Verrucomicrobiota bacterium]
MFGVKGLRKELEENTAQLRELRAAVGRLLTAEDVAKLVQVGVNAAKLDTTPVQQFDLSPADTEKHRA